MFPPTVMTTQRQPNDNHFPPSALTSFSHNNEAYRESPMRPCRLLALHGVATRRGDCNTSCCEEG